MSENLIRSKHSISNVISFNQYRFKTDVIWIDWYGDRKQFAVVSLAKTTLGEEYNGKQTRTEISVIHPITEFIMSKYSARKYTTMKKHSDNLTSFLNYLLSYGRKLNIDTIKDLKLSHGTSFLTYLGSEKKVAKSTVKQYERTLTNFYVFLANKGLIPHIPASKFEKKKDQWGGSFYLSPFKGVIFPAPSKKAKEHAFPLKYFPLLLEIAILETPRIALGIYLQFFGGLRVGEVVNIKREQAKRRVKNGDFLIRLNDQHFRSDIKDRSGSSVKRAREQEFFNIKNWLTVLFEDHTVRFRPCDGSNALFVNRDGKAMTAKSYSQYFNRVKKIFCDYLKAYGDEEDIAVSDHLRIVDWSTHIGRGTFTNMIAENTDNPFLIAYKRGDKDMKSALPYIAKTSRLRKKIENLFRDLNNDYIPKLVTQRNRRNN